MATAIKYWLCYVNGIRACGPIEVVPVESTGGEWEYSWQLAPGVPQDPDVVDSAKWRDCPNKPGLYPSKTGGSVYFITPILIHATMFLEGARAARACIANYAQYDAGPVKPIRSKVVNTDDGAGRGHDAEEDRDDEHDRDD